MSVSPPTAVVQRGVMTLERRPASASVAVLGVPFVQFYEEHYVSIARALSSTLGDASLGQEAADEAMTRAYGQWNTVREYANPAGWVYRVGYNWGISRRRRLARRLPWSAEQVALPTMPDVSLEGAIQSLDPKFRSVVVCRYLLDWSTEQTAEALDIPANTVKSRLATALARLRQDLSPPPTSTPLAMEQQ